MWLCLLCTSLLLACYLYVVPAHIQICPFSCNSEVGTLYAQSVPTPLLLSLLLLLLSCHSANWSCTRVPSSQSLTSIYSGTDA